MVTPLQTATFQTGCLLALMGVAAVASGQEAAAPTPLESRYLATLYAPLHAPQAVAANLLIFHPRPGGTLSGRIQGTLLPPGGDWVRVLPDGTMRIDVRLSVELDDGALLYVTYGGVLRKPDADSWDRFLHGDKIEGSQWYYIVTPNFETSSHKYGWLNGVQAVGKLVSIQTGERAHVQFDLFEIQ